MIQFKMPFPFCGQHARPIARSLLVVIVLVCMINSHLWAQRPPAVVVVTKVVEQTLSATETFIGTAAPKRRSIVGCAVDGRMFKFYVDEGDLVEMAAAEDETDTDEKNADVSLAGQPIAQLRTKTIEIQVSAARAELLILDNELKQLEKSLPQQLVQAQSRLASAEANQKQAVADFERMQALYKQNNVISQSDFDRAESASVSAAQDLLAAQSMVDELEATSELKLAQSEAKQLAQEIEVRRMEDLKSKYTIRTPFRGHVVKKLAEVGQWIKQGDPIAEVIELDPIEIEFDVPAEYIAPLESAIDELSGRDKKLVVQVQFDALPDHLFPGHIARIVPDANTRTRAIPVQVEVENPHDAGHPIKPGMLARAALAVGKNVKQTLVPKDALVLGGPSPLLYIVVADPKDTKMKSVRPATVELGASMGSLIAVRGQVKAGDQVVVEGNERLRPGQSIRISKEIPPK